MNKLEETVLTLQRKLPDLSKKAIYDTTDKGEEFCEVVYPNPHDQSLPLTLCIYEDGINLSFGNMEFVTGEERLSVEEIISEINDIVSDKVIFIFSYDSQKKKNDKRLSQSFVFHLDEQSEEYEKFLAKIKSPLNKFSRYFAVLKGVFVITSFSGSIKFEIER